MTEELAQIINSNLEAAFVVANNIDQATDRLMEQLGNEVLEILKEIEPNGYVLEWHVNLHQRYSLFEIYKNDWQYARIAFQFQEYGKKLVFGVITWEDMRKKPMPEKLKNELFRLGGSIHKDNWWPISSEFEEPFNKNWKTSFEPYIGISDGRLKASIKIKVLEMIELIGDLRL